MSDARDLTVDQLRELLHLEPHPTGGFVAETHRSEDRIAAGGPTVRFADGYPRGSALTFLVTPEARVHPHRIRQLYHHDRGDPLDVLRLLDDGSRPIETIGSGLARGQHVAPLIPGGTFHTAHLADGGRRHLGASTEWPGVEPSDVEVVDVRERGERYPALHDHLGRASR